MISMPGIAVGVVVSVLWLHANGSFRLQINWSGSDLGSHTTTCDFGEPLETHILDSRIGSQVRRGYFRADFI